MTQDPSFFIEPGPPLCVTSGSLVFSATRETLACPNVACFEACPVEGGDGAEVAVCRPEFRPAARTATA